MGKDDPRTTYISATPQPSPNSSNADPSCIQRHESSSSAYNTAESLPSSHYSDGKHTLERVLNAASTMYTTQANLEHTIQLQEELFRQRLRLRGIHLDEGEEEKSEHYYDNIDSETSDIDEKKKKQNITSYRHRSLPWSKKQSQRVVTFEKKLNETTKSKPTANRVRFNDQYYSLGKRKANKPSKSILCKYTNTQTMTKQKKSSPSDLLTVTIT